jgi:hypothetical protein
LVSLYDCVTKVPGKVFFAILRSFSRVKPQNGLSITKERKYM